MACVYVLSNEFFKNLYKIGFTEGAAADRSIQLHTTGIPKPFKVEREWCFTDVTAAAKAEKFLHQYFAGKRFASGREFFEISLADIDKLINEKYPEVFEDLQKRIAAEKIAQERRKKELEQIRLDQEKREFEKLNLIKEKWRLELHYDQMRSYENRLKEAIKAEFGIKRFIFQKKIWAEVERQMIAKWGANDYANYDTAKPKSGVTPEWRNWPRPSEPKPDDL